MRSKALSRPAASMRSSTSGEGPGTADEGAAVGVFMASDMRLVAKEYVLRSAPVNKLSA